MPPINYVDPDRDLPSAFVPKRVILYKAGLKIYGVLPHLLAKRLQAEFHSNRVGAIIAPTGERNFTFVPYRRADGKRHSDVALQQLTAWLREGKGFEVGVAEGDEFHNPLDNNFLQSAPRVFVPDDLPHLMSMLLPSGEE